MNRVTKEQVRHFRLHAHHLDAWYGRADAVEAAGACGFQNSPPGAWEAALHSRVPDLSLEEMRGLLEEDKTLLQAWSFRGAPVVFPARESDVFLSALVPGQGEPWIYTQGIQLALDFLQMSFDEALSLLVQVMVRLEGETLKSKTALDQTLAQWMLPLLPAEKRDLWNSPSMYGSPDRQTVGGGAVSFLLRPCAFLGLVVFGKREGISPTFTAYHSWTGRSLEVRGTPEQRLARKYLHCFGPASPSGLAGWLGCSPAQARRIWSAVAEEVEPVSMEGKERYLLSSDAERLASPSQPERRLHLLGAHDPYLGLQDRDVILEDKTRQRQIWQTVSNPGAVLRQGEAVGMWRPRKKGKGLEIQIQLWDAAGTPKGELQDLGEEYAAFQQLKLNKITISE